MGREASDLTKAIRKLCQQTDFRITHSEARSHLRRMGFKIAPEPQEKSENYKRWEAKRTGKYPKEPEKLLAYYRATVRAAGLPIEISEAIMKEDAPHRAFNNERNNFDVTKWNYHRAFGGNVSRKARTKTTAPEKEAVAALNWLLENGGAAAVQRKVQSLKNELAQMLKMLEKASTLHKHLPSAA